MYVYNGILFLSVMKKCIKCVLRLDRCSNYLRNVLYASADISYDNRNGTSTIYTCKKTLKYGNILPEPHPDR